MSKLVWDADTQRLYETGTDRGVVYPKSKEGAYQTGAAWNGLTAVTQSPSGAEANKQYADNIVYLNLRGAEEFGCTIEAFTYPDEFKPCDGIRTVNGVDVYGQTRRGFGFSYRTLLGNDAEATDYGYKIHLVYNATTNPSEKSYATVNDSPEPITMSWEVSTTPVPVTTKDADGNDLKPVAHLEITVTEANKDSKGIKDLEAALYGVDADTEHQIEAAAPYLPTPDQVFAMLAA